jgi:hypothetical protein
MNRRKARSYSGAVEHMIDLTKPIRVKGKPEPVKIVGPVYRVRFSGGDQAFRSMEELERDYENIPEPRKPREFVMWERDGNLFGMDLLGGVRIRVIEWPEGAELPEWPNG